MNEQYCTDKTSNFPKSTVKSTVVPHLSSDAPPSLLTENGQVFNNSILQSLQWKPGMRESRYTGENSDWT